MRDINMKNVKSVCENCNKDDYYAFKCFKYSKLKLSNLLEEDLNAKSESYVNFLSAKNDIEARIDYMVKNSLNDLRRSEYDFSPNVYLNIDKLMTRWKSWFTRFTIYLKTLLITGKTCDYFYDTIKYSIIDYYNESSDLPLKEEFMNFFINWFFENLDKPIKNGDFVTTINEVGRKVILFFKIIIIQFAQLDIYNKNILFYSKVFQKLDNDLEEKIIEFHLNNMEGKVKVKNLTNHLSYIEGERFKKLMIKYKERLSNFNEIFS